MQSSKLKTLLTTSRSHILLLRNVAVNAPGDVYGEQDTPVEGKPWQEIPGPTTLPVIGQMHHFLPGGMFYKQTPNVLVKTAFPMYGPIIRIDGLLGIPPAIFLFDPESTAQVLRGEDWLPNRPGFQTLQYYRSTYKYNNKKTNVSTGLLADQGDNWKKFRSTVAPVMLQPRTIKLYKAALGEVSEEMIERMKSVRGEDNRLKSKLDVEMNLWALESIGVVALGTRLNCFDPNLPADSPARKFIRLVHDIFDVVEKLDFKPSIWRYFPTSTFKRAMKLYEQQEKLTNYFIGKAKADFQLIKKTDEEKSILEKLLEIDEKFAQIMALDMFFAGTDSTANALIFTLYLLATNPEKQEKLRADILSQEDRKPYLKACIKESLRLYPPAASNVRLTTKDYNLLGYKIPKNVYVIFKHHVMSRFEEQFKNAEEFIPERWLVPNDDPLYYRNAHPFAYSPFGFGARMCIGRRIAELEIETFLSRLVQNFQVEWFGPPLKVTQITLNYPTGPFNFIFKDV